jgi:hypothetical protein
VPTRSRPAATPTPRGEITIGRSRIFRKRSSSIREALACLVRAAPHIMRSSTTTTLSPTTPPRLSSKNARCWYNRGLTYASLHDYDHAIDNYAEALKLARDAHIWQRLAAAEYSRGANDRAIVGYSEAIGRVRTMPRFLAIGAVPIMPKAITRAPSQTFRQRSSSIPIMPARSGVGIQGARAGIELTDRWSGHPSDPAAWHTSCFEVFRLTHRLSQVPIPRNWRLRPLHRLFAGRPNTNVGDRMCQVISYFGMKS